MTSDSEPRIIDVNPQPVPPPKDSQDPLTPTQQLVVDTLDEGIEVIKGVREVAKRGMSFGQRLKAIASLFTTKD